jgi:hypothetical protein
MPLGADRDFCGAEMSLTKARRDDLLSLVQLYGAFGGGCQK